MHWIDLGIFVVYMVAMLAVGWYFYRSNTGREDYYVGGRNLGSWHIGMSVVATDVGGGFSIGLGGLGFTMGLSGSWMLFTGLIGAWLCAVVLVPRVFRLGRQINAFTFPQVFAHYYGGRVALIAAVISAIGYLGFTASQMLAGAKLASASIDGLSTTNALIVMGVIAVGYTVMGGLKAVVYTDTIQWIILLAGLLFIGLPMGYWSIGGWEAIQRTVAPEMIQLTHVNAAQLFNWAITIIPIWFIGMTLYQRIYACRDERQARKAWFIAGLFEWPLMAFMGVALGLFARIAADQGAFEHLGFAGPAGMDSETGLPLLLKTVLPVGLTGLMLSAYFSAILSTADSCLMACSGNVVSDLLGSRVHGDDRKELRWSQWVTLGIGVLAIVIAMFMRDVLSLMLHSYAFMVSGLFVPVLFALYGKTPNATGAWWSMFCGGISTLVLTLVEVPLPGDIDPIAIGLLASLVAYAVASRVGKTPRKQNENQSSKFIHI